jgi:hypothetical protein
MSMYVWRCDSVHVCTRFHNTDVSLCMSSWCLCECIRNLVRYLGRTNDKESEVFFWLAENKKKMRQDDQGTHSRLRRKCEADNVTVEALKGMNAPKLVARVSYPPRPYHHSLALSPSLGHFCKLGYCLL